MLEYLHKLRRRLVLPEPIFRLISATSTQFQCPICNYTGAFRIYRPGTGSREHAQCPGCRALERHRLQHLAIEQVFAERDLANSRLIHFAPEPFFRERFATRGLKSYETADLMMKGVDHKVDLCDLPFEDNSFDIVFASHILEHISDDRAALSEIARILAPGGVALLPVPVVVECTIEYGEANPLEEHHVRAIGVDYFQRYNRYFSSVKLLQSSDFPSQYQVYVYEDRSAFPTSVCPKRTPMCGEKHPDYVPLCFS